MRRARLGFGGLVACVVLAVSVVVLRAIVPIDSGTPSLVFPITINAGDGDQYHAHVDANIASYTSDFDIRYYDFFTGQDVAIPHAASGFDWLSDVSNGKIAFTRTGTDGGYDVYVYDTTTQVATPIALSSSSHRYFPSIGGNTVAFVDGGTWGAPAHPDVYVADLGNPATAIQLTNDTRWEGYSGSGVAVSPAGDVIAWDSCDFTAGDRTTCEIYKATRAGTSWTVTRVTTNADEDQFPRTDGTVITWISTRGGEQDIYWQAVAGGEEHRLEIPGQQGRWPTVAGGVIAVESVAVGETAADLYVYQIATNRLFRITSTPDDEELSDIAALPDGRLRIVWDSGDPAQIVRNVYGATIELPAVSGGNYSFGGFLQPVDPLPTVNVMKAGAAVPVKFSLGGNKGLNIFATGYPRSASIPCSSTALTAAIEETATAGGSSLQYDATTDVYTYIWKTDKGWAGTCRQLVIQFADSSVQYANFKFK